MSKYNVSQALVSNAPGAYYAIFASDFGAPVPAAPLLTYEAGSGSLATTTAYIKVTWITDDGVSLPSAVASVAVAAASGAVSIAEPTVPAGQNAVIGWQIYSGSTSATTVKLNTSSTSTSPAPVSIVTTEGTETGFLVATTTVLLEVYGTGAVVPVTDASGIQPGLPSVPANSAVEYYAIIPNTGSQWKQQKAITYMNADGIAETTGITLNVLNFIQPVYPGVGASVTAGAWMVINGYLFLATTGGTTASTFIGFSNFNLKKGATTTDGTVVWTSYGKAGLARFLFSNVTAGGALTPTAREYGLFQN